MTDSTIDRTSCDDDGSADGLHRVREVTRLLNSVITTKDKR